MESFVVELSHEEEELRKIIEPLLDSEGFELVRLSLKRGHAKSILGIFVDTLGRPNGVTMGNLESISRFLSDVFDAIPEGEGPLRASYELEISSPGLDRPLTKASHFRASLDERLKLRLKNPTVGAKNIYGRLIDADEKTITLEPEGLSQGPLQLLYEDLAEAHLIFNFASKVPEKKRKSS